MGQRGGMECGNGIFKSSPHVLGPANQHPERRDEFGASLRWSRAWVAGKTSRISSGVKVEARSTKMGCRRGHAGTKRSQVGRTSSNDVTLRSPKV